MVLLPGTPTTFDALLGAGRSIIKAVAENRQKLEKQRRLKEALEEIDTSEKQVTQTFSPQTGELSGLTIKTLTPKKDKPRTIQPAEVLRRKPLVAGTAGEGRVLTPGGAKVDAQGFIRDPFGKIIGETEVPLRREERVKESPKPKFDDFLQSAFAGEIAFQDVRKRFPSKAKQITTARVQNLGPRGASVFDQIKTLIEDADSQKDRDKVIGDIVQELNERREEGQSKNIDIDTIFDILGIDPRDIKKRRKKILGLF